MSAPFTAFKDIFKTMISVRVISLEAIESLKQGSRADPVIRLQPQGIYSGRIVKCRITCDNICNACGRGKKYLAQIRRSVPLCFCGWQA
jgi:hypothetical protein